MMRSLTFLVLPGDQELGPRGVVYTSASCFPAIQKQRCLRHGRGNWLAFSKPPWAIFRDGWYILSHRLLCFVATFSGLFARNNSRGGWRYRSKTARCMGEKSLIDRFLVSSHFLHYTSERRTPRREWASGLVNKFLFFFFSCYRWTFISSQQRRSARLQ